MFVICKICWYLTKFEMFSLGQWTGTQSSVHRTICEWNGGKVPRTRQPTAKSSTDRWPQGKEQTVEECKCLENLDGNMSILVWKKLILSFSKYRQKILHLQDANKENETTISELKEKIHTVNDRTPLKVNRSFSNINLNTPRSPKTPKTPALAGKENNSPATLVLSPLRVRNN